MLAKTTLTLAALATIACTTTPEPIPPPHQCSAESCPVRIVVISEVEDDPVAASVSSAEGVVEALDAGEVEWIESQPNEEPSP